MVDKNNFDAEIAKRKKTEYMREWRKKNPDKVKANNERYWARKFERDLATGEHSEEN